MKSGDLESLRNTLEISNRIVSISAVLHIFISTWWIIRIISSDMAFYKRI
jgi:hypothetical protein